MTTSAELSPTSLSELTEAVRSAPRVLAVGAGTKPSLAALDVAKLSTSRLQGILEYDPSEFTFTALAGTPLKEIAAALAERGQYLPFDPLFVAGGATLGGTVAAGLSGPGRLRYGGMRDFILGVCFVDGAGRLLRMGGKVVKNAAGFDLPKFFVGSLGRFGVLAELTFKVFPSPPARLTLRLATNTVETAARMLTEIANTRWEPEALDLPPGDDRLCVRLAGPAVGIEEISREILARWPGEKVPAANAEAIWAGLCDFAWARSGGLLLKLALTTAVLPALARSLSSLDGVLHVSAGGNMGFLSLPSQAQPAALDEQLRKLNLRGLALRGQGPLWYGLRNQSKIAEGVKKALDPENRFPSLDE
jgi:glycolate oxidase FAD binding subunit